MSARGIVVTYEPVRQWCRKSGPQYARNLRRRHGRLGNVWYLDEVFVKIQGKRYYLWRAVDKLGHSAIQLTAMVDQVTEQLAPNTSRTVICRPPTS